MQDRLPFEAPAPQAPAPEPEEERSAGGLLRCLRREIHDAEFTDVPPEVAKGSARD